MGTSRLENTACITTAITTEEEEIKAACPIGIFGNTYKNMGCSEKF
jgi:hypothetical protein